MKIIANCGCDRWAEVLAKKMFERNKIPCKEAYIVHIDYKWITLDAETCGEEPEEKRYVIKCWEEKKLLFISLLSVWFYERKMVDKVNAVGECYKGDEIVDIEKGAYLVTNFLGLVGCKKIE